MKLMARLIPLFAAALLLGAISLPDVFCQDPPAADRMSAEENGIDLPDPAPAASFEATRGAGNGGVLLIPESTNDTVGMYDPYDGAYLGDIIASFAGFTTPINAIMGPDGRVYVSDQVEDAVRVFDKSGNYLSTYADSSDGLDNIRGISFFNGRLYVTSGADYVAVFDGPHSRLPNFVAAGCDPFDIYFFADGSALVADIGGDNISLYGSGGALIRELFAVDFPEQIQFDCFQNGLLLHNSYGADEINDFDETGAIFDTCACDGGRGVYRLGNGNFLATNGDGVFELDSGTGAVIEQKNSGSARFIEFVSLNTGALTADASILSASAGGSVHFTLDAGPGNAGRMYVLFGSGSGTVPGTPVYGGNVLPLNMDAVFMKMLLYRNGQRFQDFRRPLDAAGRGSAALNTLGPVPPAVPVGSSLYFAFTLTFPFDFQSNAVEVEIVP